MSFRQTSGLLAAVARRWGERRGALAARPHICPRSTGWVPATPTETGLTFSSPHHLFITMGPPVVPTPLCSAPLTRSLVLVLCLSVAPRSSSLCYLGIFFPSLQKSLYKIAFLFTFCKFQNPLVAVKPQHFEEPAERRRRSSAEGRRGDKSVGLPWKRGFSDEAFVKARQPTTNLESPRCLLSAFRPVFLHIVGNFSVLARGIIRSWPI